MRKLTNLIYAIERLKRIYYRIDLVICYPSLSTLLIYLKQYRQFGIVKTMKRQLQFQKFKQQISIIGPVNNTKTVLIARNNKSEQKQYLIKVINFNGIETMLDNMPAILKRVYGSNQPIIYKPEYYVMDETNRCLLLVEQVFSLSLEGLILYHRHKKEFIDHWLIHNFACKLYDSINRIKNSGTEFYHRNLKPSNIFIEIKQSQIQWKITQFGLVTRFPNKYYQSITPTSIKSKTNISNISDQYENDLHALAIILLQMITLTPIDIIYQTLTQNKSVKDIKNIKQAQNQYGNQVIDFIVELLKHRDNSKDAFQKFKDSTPEFKELPKYHKTKIQWDYKRFEKIANEKQNPYQTLITKLKKQIEDKNIKCEEVIKEAEKYDPDLQFIITTYDNLFYFMREFGVELDDEELVEVSFMMRCASAMNYMDIMKECFEAKLIIQAIIKTGIETFPTRKQFFLTNSGGRDFWSAEDITKYLHSLNVHIDGKQVSKVVQGWSGLNKRTSIKYQQFNKLFKGIGNQTATATKDKSKAKSQASQKTIQDVLNQLKLKLEQEHKNLVSFFRLHDKTNKWIVGPEIDKAIKNRIVIPDKVFSEICEEMWQIAGVSNETKKILLYVKLLKQTKIYSVTELFKLIVVEKINQSSRQAVYREFEKDQKGWNLHSLQDFNDKQGLDFDPRQLNIIFSQIDKDRSGYLSQKQLIFSLTGLKQFDKDFILSKIRQQLDRKSWDLFAVFMKFDANKDLYLDLPYNLQQIFEYLEIDIPPEHCIDLFNNGKRNDKFPYMEFLRNFVPNSELFIKACMFFIDYFYDGNFQKFYEMGRIKNRKKWNLESFNYINQYYIMGFTYNEVGQIWSTVNPDNQQSLTKQQVAKIFNCSCESDENILAIDSVEKPKYEQKSKISKQQAKVSDRRNVKQAPTPKQGNKNKNQLIEAILDKKLNDVTICFMRKSRECGELSLSNFCSCLDQLKIKYLRNTVMKNTVQFQRMDNQNNLMINFVNFLMFACQSQDQGRQQRKAHCMTIILEELIKFYELSTEQIFKKCKRTGKMRLTDYENFIRDLIKTEVYFDDIEDTWKYWGSPEYLSPEDFNKIISSPGFAGINQQKLGLKVARHFSFAQQTKGVRQEPAESPYFPVKSRKSSKDSRDVEIQPYQLKNSQHEKNSKYRNSFKQEPKYSNLPPKPSVKRNSQFKQPEYDRKYEKKQQKKQQRRQSKKEQRKEEKKQLTKAYVTQKFENKLKQRGSEALNSLFSRMNAVSAQQFAAFVQSNYDMQPNQCEKLAEAFNSFGKVKIETMKKYIKKIESPQKADKIEYERQRQPVKRDSQKRQTLIRKQISKSKDAKQSPQVNENLRLEDPRKMRINVPLVKQHIKILTGSFAKKFDVNQMQPYFFEGNTTINKEDFIKKCCEINSSISKSMYEKIFSYLKPKAGLVSSVSFKLSFSFDEDIQIEQAYLPQEIDKQIKAIFEKNDKDNSGFIQIHEIQSILGSLGLNETQKEIQIYFQRIDQNFDKKISLKEFKIFIQDNILPYISDFDEDADHLTNLLKMNDVFRTGYLPVTTIGAVLERYGVKLGEKDLNTLNRFMATENGQISIKQLINRLYFPSNQTYAASLKAVLYRIRWKRRITFKQIQKIFQNISASFVMSYTGQVVKNKFVSPSTFITPVLNQCRFFYNDFYYKNFGKLEERVPNLVTSLKPSDLVVEIKLVDASGIPIPQNAAVKNGILNRSVNVIFYDTSIEEAKDCILNLQVQFDPDVEDQWVFNKNNRSIFVKIANYEPRKYEKIFVLFEFVVTIVDGQRCMDVSCGSASFPVKQLQVQAKTTRKYKMIAGLPNKSKDIDKMSISKRKGWRGIIGSGEIESQFQIEVVPSSKFQEKVQFLAALPQKSIVNRKAVHLFWTFREYFAFKSADQKRVNPDFGNHFIVRTFLLCLDIPDVNEELYSFWKQRIQPKATAVDIARKIFHHLMLDLHLVINSKQFQLLPSYPSKNTFGNKSLKSTRKKLIQQVFGNIEEWVASDPKKDYRRKKPYNVDSSPFIIEQRELTPQIKNISSQLMKVK